MPRRRKGELIQCEYFRWVLGKREGMYVADGRANRPSLGRHSLGTREHREAIETIKKLDLLKAVEAGHADRAMLEQMNDSSLPLREGRDLYAAHIARARVLGGARPTTVKRYRPVFDKFESFAQGERITTWNQVDRRVLERYAAHLDDQGYAYATEYLELTTLKQMVKWLINEKKLPAQCAIHLPLRKPQGTTTYCWRPDEIQAMISHCHERPDLRFLADILLALACTGLRISELASLRWRDIDLENNIVTLTDESHRPSPDGAERRQTKSGRSRSFPIHQNLRAILDNATRAKDGLVFHGPRGGRLKPDTIRNLLIRDVLRPLNKRFPSVKRSEGFMSGRLHSFRHYFCSTCANTGIPEPVVKEWLGHADSKMIRRYYHLHDEESQRQMRRPNFFGSAVGNVAVSEHSVLAEETTTRPTS